jgi:D-alanyl-D-alanine carboxypeptidase
MLRIVNILLMGVLSVWAIVCEASELKSIDPVILQTNIHKMARALGVPGAFVLLRVANGEYLMPYGTSQLGTDIKPSANMHFRIASNTKTMTSAVIILLAQEGKLKLTDPIAKYIFDVPNGNKITIADLLRMRSGLYNYTDSPRISQSLDTTPEKMWTLEALMDIALKKPPLFEPGTAFHYSNTNYLLLGLVAEKVSGKSLQALFEERLFKPLGMKHTLLPKLDSNQMPLPFSHGYLYGSSAVALVGESLTPQFKAAVRAGKIKLIDCTNQNPSFALGTGGVVSTADDLAIWAHALVDGKLFNAKYQSIWLNSFLPESPERPQGQKYGLGMRALRFGSSVIYYHGGEMPGFNSYFVYDPKNDMTLVVWTNLANSLEGKLTAGTIMSGILKDLYKTFPK